MFLIRLKDFRVLLYRDLHLQSLPQETEFFKAETFFFFSISLALDTVPGIYIIQAPQMTSELIMKVRNRVIVSLISIITILISSFFALLGNTVFQKGSVRSCSLLSKNIKLREKEDRSRYYTQKNLSGDLLNFKVPSPISAEAEVIKLCLHAISGLQNGLDFIPSETQLYDMSLSELRELVMDREAWRAAIHGVAKSRT